MSQALHYASRRIDVTKRSTYLNIWVSSEEVEVGPSLVLRLPRDNSKRLISSDRLTSAGAVPARVVPTMHALMGPPVVGPTPFRSEVAVLFELCHPMHALVAPQQSD